MDLGTFSLRFALALLMGALIGVERQWRQRMAGARTNALVAAGASAFVMSERWSTANPAAIVWCSACIAILGYCHEDLAAYGRLTFFCFDAASS